MVLRSSHPESPWRQQVIFYSSHPVDWTVAIKEDNNVSYDNLDSPLFFLKSQQNIQVFTMYIRTY